MCKKKISSLLLFVMTMTVGLLLFSCSKDSAADLAGLLRTVPSDAGMVVTFDLERVATLAGCSVDDGKIVVSADMSRQLESVVDPKTRERIRMFLDGESGVALTDMVVFSQGYHTYATGLLTDPEAFRKYLSAGDSKYAFTVTDGVEHSQDVAISGNQFWCVDRGAIDPLDVKAFVGLTEKQSFASTDYAATLESSDSDLRGIVSTTSPLVGGQGFVKQAQTQMLLSTLFSDAAYIEFDMKLSKGTGDLTLRMLTSRFKGAKYNFPVAKIDTGAVKSLQGSGGCAFAVGISKDLTKKIVSLLSGTGGMGKIYGSLIAPLDGTAAFVGNIGQGTAASRISGFVGTTGSGLTPLTTMIDQAGIGWKQEGNTLLLSTAQVPQGGITGEIFAGECGDALCAFMMDSAQIKSMAGGKDLPLDRVTAVLKPAGSSLELKVHAEGNSGDKGLVVLFIEKALR